MFKQILFILVVGVALVVCDNGGAQKNQGGDIEKSAGPLPVANPAVAAASTTVKDKINANAKGSTGNLFNKIVGGSEAWLKQAWQAVADNKLFRPRSDKKAQEFLDEYKRRVAPLMNNYITMEQFEAYQASQGKTVDYDFLHYLRTGDLEAYKASQAAQKEKELGKASADTRRR